jgi:uncharacterized protein YdbL (DUF1318 family)
MKKAKTVGENIRATLARLQKQQRNAFEASIAKAIRTCPDCSYAEIGKEFGLTAGRIAQIALKFKVRRKRGPKEAA